MKKISLTSIWAKILASYLFFLSTPLAFCILFMVDKKNIWASAFMVFAWLFITFALFMIFYSKIIIKNDLVIFRVFWWFKPKKYKIEVKNIENVYLDDNNISNVIHVITKDAEIKFTGYNSLKGRSNNLQQSKRIVAMLYELCNKKSN